jgi:hypothetical protein
VQEGANALFVVMQSTFDTVRGAAWTNIANLSEQGSIDQGIYLLSKVAVGKDKSYKAL